jgi:6-pyruvoyltetrahydropterin/6-carboxytetrahydropterin synthase
MFAIHKSFSWDMGHRISQHGGKCFSPHGHRYNATVWLGGVLGDKGMVMDFYRLSQIVDPIVEELDHAFMVYEKDDVMRWFFSECNKEDRCSILQKPERPFKVKVVPFESTAENIAKYIFDRVYEKTPNVVKVEVWETPKCCAVYEINLA